MPTARPPGRRSVRPPGPLPGPGPRRPVSPGRSRGPAPPPEQPRRAVLVQQRRCHPGRLRQIGWAHDVSLPSPTDRPPGPAGTPPPPGRRSPTPGPRTAAATGRLSFSHIDMPPQHIPLVNTSALATNRASYFLARPTGVAGTSFSLAQSAAVRLSFTPSSKASSSAPSIGPRRETISSAFSRISR